MSEKEMLDLTTEVAKEIAKESYKDGGKPVVKPTGELVGLVPRAIKAALSPLEKWILQREYNVAETKKLLEEKLQNTPAELIESPEPHIAVPAMQYISYCMDNEELRKMYANLLANSMNKVVKNGVHPCFIEITKQLCPDEAKLLNYIYTNYKITGIPIIGFNLQKIDGTHLYSNILFSDVPYICGCENYLNQENYWENLERLGLLKFSFSEYFLDESVYEPLINNDYVKKLKEELEKQPSSICQADYIKGAITLTSFGKNFCSICLDIPNNTKIEKLEGEKI